MANLDNIVPGLRARGLKVVETPGWITRGYDGQDLQEIRGVLWHHTATTSARFTATGAPTLQMCIDGRSDLAGPLCNLVLGRDGTVYIVATGVANHAGFGSAPYIPTDMGNHYMIGIEMESSGVAPWDWTPAQLAAAPRLGAALEQMYLQGFPEEQRIQLGHYEYSSTGKIDPAGWPGGMDGLRASINAILAGQASVPAPKPAPAPKPTPKPAPAPAAPQLWLRTVTNPVAYARVAPYSNAACAVEVAQGAQLAVKAYVAGQDPYGNGDNAWYVTKSGYYVWANAASNDISGLPYWGQK